MIARNRFPFAVRTCSTGSVFIVGLLVTLNACSTASVEQSTNEDPIVSGSQATCATALEPFEAILSLRLVPSGPPVPDGSPVSFGTYERQDADGTTHEGDFTYQHDNIRDIYELVFETGHDAGARLLDLYKVDLAAEEGTISLQRFTLQNTSLVTTGPTFSVTNPAGSAPTASTPTAKGYLKVGTYRLGEGGISWVELAPSGPPVPDGSPVSFGTYQRQDADGTTHEGDFTYQHDNIRDIYELVFETGHDADARPLDMYAVCALGNGVSLSKFTTQGSKAVAIAPTFSIVNPTGPAAATGYLKGGRYEIAPRK